MSPKGDVLIEENPIRGDIRLYKIVGGEPIWMRTVAKQATWFRNFFFDPTETKCVYAEQLSGLKHQVHLADVSGGNDQVIASHAGIIQLYGFMNGSSVLAKYDGDTRSAQMRIINVSSGVVEKLYTGGLSGNMAVFDEGKCCIAEVGW